MIINSFVYSEKVRRIIFYKVEKVILKC